MLRNFYARRALRIFPAYYLVLGLAAVTVGIAYLPVYLLYVMNWGIFFYTWIEPGLVDRAWEPTRMYGIHFWSLCVEEQFYVVFPLLFTFLRPGRARLSWLLALWVLSIGFRFVFAAFLPKSAYGLIPLVCGEYLIAGAVGAVVFADTSRTAEWIRTAARRWMFPAGLVTVAALFVLFRPRLRRSTTSCTRRTCRRCLPSDSWRWCWDCGKRIAVGCSPSSTYAPLRYLGRISYGLYLIHLFMWPLVDWLSARSSLVRDLPPFAARLGLTVLLAAAMWHLVEAPILALKRKFPY